MAGVELRFPEARSSHPETPTWIVFAVGVRFSVLG